MLKTEAEGLGFQHQPRDLANVNAWKTMFDPYIVMCMYSSYAFGLAVGCRRHVGMFMFSASVVCWAVGCQRCVVMFMYISSVFGLAVGNRDCVQILCVWLGCR